ncbi:efflux RND transporter permease subunit [Rubellimicrobium sp. CFH 75288]|uniref:efflux RND transporter permease subunit n=1 Tax=Rubellimicrobium sp. CFH 75288 TaxID=2697034 RepID=UPI00141245BA|nr:efflux RND transporter permease subunit [Rubellimicrobium sp. CFH 75288]NAZ36176.1 AcrB/AcrD/AcrF family protein [Rubellimicrobium sp. CFH 75288]
MFLTRISVAQPVFAAMVMLAITIFGLVSYSRLPIEQFPDVDFPVVAVVVAYPGASPEAVEQDVVRPIEDAVATVSGIDDIRSTAQQGQAIVVMFFDLEVRSADAAQDVRDKMAGLRAVLPDGVEEPTVLRFDPAEQPIVSLALSSDTVALRDLTALADEVVARRILAIQGVGRASVVGGTGRQVDILLDPDRMNAYGIGVGQITAALAAENRDRPAGEIADDQTVQAVTVEGRLQDAEDFLAISVGQTGGLPVTLGDVATVHLGEGETTSLALLDGERALAVDVVKQQGANTVAVARAIRAAAADLQENVLPPGVHLEIIRDNAVAVEESFESVQAMLIEGAALAVVIVFLFLNSWRSTVITGLTLPISIIGTMTALYALGFTLNIMTLLALSIAIGMLIDDAIVVRENITRHLHMGKSHVRAALEGTREIGLAVVATTLTIIAVFLPVAFMEGILGRFFLQFGVTVSVAVAISLFIAFTLDPMLSSVWYDPASDPRTRKGIVWRTVAWFDRGFQAVGRGYGRLLRWSLRHRLIVTLVAVAVFAGSFALVPRVGVEFSPAVDNSEFQVEIVTPTGSSLDYTASKIRQVEAILRTFPEVTRTYATVNSGTQTGGTNSARITVSLVPPEERDRTPQEMTAPVRRALAVVPGIDVNVGAAGGLGQISTPIEITIQGDSFEILEGIADDLAARLAAIEGVEDVTTSLADTRPTLAVRLDRDAADDLGVSIGGLGDTLSTLLGGQRVGDWTSPDGRAWAVNVQLPEGMRNDPAQLGALPVATQGGRLVRLDQVAQIAPSVGPAEITRSGQSRTVTVEANLSGVTLGEVQPRIAAAQDEVPLPPGYRILQRGEAEQLARSAASAGQALVLAIVFIYLVLASQFGSFLQPLAIMTSLPLSLIGVLLGLIVGGSTLNIFSAIGFIMLMGLVVKNAILLVDNANQRVAEGMHLYDALVEAGLTRFRPIVMTTLAMIFGMMPLALNLHGGSGQNAPMAHAVIGGLISSSLLTLVVVPVALTAFDAFGRRIRRWLPRHPDHHGAPAE